MTDLPSLAGHGAISVDLETKDPDLKLKGSAAHKGAPIVGVAVATEAGYRAYLPVGHESGDNLPREQVMMWLLDQMKLPCDKVGANLVYDLGFLLEAGIAVNGAIRDVQIAEPLLDENRLSYSLEAIARDRIGQGKHDEELDAYLVAHFGKKNPKSNIYRAPPEVVGPYAVADADIALRTWQVQESMLRAEDLWDLFEMESQLPRMLARMRRHGVRVDVQRAEQMYADLTKKQRDLEKEIRRQTGIEPQIWASSSLAQIFDYLGLKYPLTPKTKKPSFVAGYLESVDHAVVDMVLEARKLDKMRGTFLEGCIIDNHYRGRVHCNFNQLKGEGGGTVTGRFSSSGPNLQFIPVRDDMGKVMRSIFLPDEGRAWFKLDYSQIEYVLMLHDANDSNLPGAKAIADEYRQNEDADFHQLVADMTGLERGPAKTINFGLAYGEGIDKLCRQLGLTREDGEKLITEYHRGAPFMRPLIQGCMARAAMHGEIRTLLNRKRRFDAWEIWNRETKEKVILHHRVNGARRAFTHKALNARTQGSAADIMKKAMVDAHKADLDGVQIQLTVHDELDGSVPITRDGYDAICHLKEVMENTVKLSVPLRVSGEVGVNWGKVTDYDDFDAWRRACPTT